MCILSFDGRYSLAGQRFSANSHYHPQCMRAFISSPLPNTRYFTHIYKFLSVLRESKKVHFTELFPMRLSIFSYVSSYLYFSSVICLQLCSDFLLGCLFCIDFQGLVIDWMWRMWKSRELKVIPGLWAQAKVETMGPFTGTGGPRGQCPGGAGEHTVGQRLGLQSLSCCHVLLPSYSRELGPEWDPELGEPQTSSISDHHSPTANSH